MFRPMLRQSLLSPMRPFATRGLAQVLKPAPAWTAKALVDGGFKTVGLDDYKGKWLVMFFYPLDFTFVCPTEIVAFSERAHEFEAVGASVVGVSVDSHFSHLAWSKQPRKDGGLGPMKIPLVSDITKAISQSYGVLVDEGALAGVALRGTFVIDPKGIVRQISINDIPVGRNVDEVLRLVEATQHADAHGEVCPIGWKKGGATIKPTVDASKAYFAKAN